MINKRYRCNDCNKFFDDAFYYNETHGLDNPPYERVSVCPHCKSGNFLAFDFNIEKLEVAQKLLSCISSINRYVIKLGDMYGPHCKNEDLQYTADCLCEFINEMFSFASSSIEKKILGCSTYSDEEMILSYLKGDV